MKITFTKINLDFYLKNPNIIGEHCCQLRKALSDAANPIPMTLFANMLNVPVIKLEQIEKGHVHDSALAIRYLLKLNAVYNLCNPHCVTKPDGRDRD